MKNKYAFFSVVVSFILITGCSSESEKGNWSKSDREKFYSEMQTVDLTGFGEHKDEWIECYYRKVEANYSSFQKADVDQEGCEKLALECVREVVSSESEKGNWSDADKAHFYKEMESVDLSGLGEHKDAWIECYLNKAESVYASFAEADTDSDGCSKLAAECADEILGDD